MTSSKLRQESQPSKQGGELWLVATPIGNLKDITLRALQVLQEADLIACEDTRTSGKLLSHYAIATPKFAYHQHNEAEATDALVSQLNAGKRIALISDAGTPLLSDPGARLVRAAASAGVRITPIPGASALLAGLTVAGLSLTAFTFAGFLPPKKAARKTALSGYIALPTTLAFYEAPHRLVDMLRDAQTVLGNREAAVARELTKLHEECKRGTLQSLAAHYEALPPKGECVVMIAGAGEHEAYTDAQVEAALYDALAHMSVKQAVAQVAAISRRSRQEVYARALVLKGQL